VRQLVRPLVGTCVRPNHLTTLRLVTGFAAAFAFADGRPGWVVAGAGTLFLSLLFDRADGELARQSGQSSRVGHLYDLITDGVSNAAVFVGIGAGVASEFAAGLGLVLGITAGASVAVAECLVLYLDSAALQKSSELGGRWGIDPDDAMFLVPIGMMLGWGGPVLLAAAIGGPLATIMLAMLVVRRHFQKRAIEKDGSHHD
jgi:archaetidylinositol phosphate synthase